MNIGKALMNFFPKNFDLKNFFMHKFFEIIILLLIGMFVIKIILRIESKTLDKKQVDKALHQFIVSGTKVLLWILLIIMLLQLIGVSTSSLIAVLGSMGVAVALALKDSLSNVAGGIIIILTKPFKHGEHIELLNGNGVNGIVDSIDLLTTRLHTFDNQILTVPNGTISTSVITNYSKASERRITLEFGIGYDSDIEGAKKILLDISKDYPLILKEPEPTVGVISQGASSVNIQLKVWTKVENMVEVTYYLQEKSKEEFDKANINIPYPQMDIHMIKA